MEGEVDFRNGSVTYSDIVGVVDGLVAVKFSVSVIVLIEEVSEPYMTVDGYFL